MRRTAKVIEPSPSIHQIIIEEQEAKLNTEIKHLFKSKTFPIFPISDLQALPNYASD